MRVAAVFSSLLLLIACTGDRVGESPLADGGGSGGADSDAGGEAGSGGVFPSDASDAGSEPQVLANARDCPSDFRLRAGTLTWAEQGSVQTPQDGLVATMPAAGCAGGGSACVTVLASGQYGPSAVELDPENGAVFWATISDGTIWRLPNGSTKPEVFSTGQNWPRWLAIEPVTLSIYWTNSGQLGQKNGEIWRAWLDSTSGGAPIVKALDSPSGLFIQSTSFTSIKLFWTNGGTNDFDGYVMASEAVGDFAKKIADAQSGPRGITATASHVYWTNLNDGSLMRAKHDGSERVRLLSNLTTPSDVALDSTRIYWVEAGSPLDYTDGSVRSAALDGSDVVKIADAQLDPRRIALDSTHVYWMNRGTQGVQACALHDGSLMRAPK